MPTTQVGFIGAGRMATALARGLVQAEIISSSAIVAVDPSLAAAQQFESAIPGATVLENNCQLAAGVDVIVLAVKPQHMDLVLADLADSTELANGGVEAPLVVSIAAGIPLAQLAAGLPYETRLVRVMPNTPCLIGRGASAYSLGTTATAADSYTVHQMLTAVGTACEVPEKFLNAVTGLSGSGPAFVYTVIESLSDGGVLMGLPRDLALALAAQTVAGAAEMVLTTGEHPAQLREAVTSPGGTTVAGLEALEKEGLRMALLQAVQAATCRSQELGGQS
jgi:pyrroline-5-carboxylate reductase